MIQANRYDHEEFSRKIWDEGRDFNDHDALAHNNFLGTRKRFQAVAVALDKLRTVRHAFKHFGSVFAEDGDGVQRDAGRLAHPSMLRLVQSLRHCQDLSGRRLVGNVCDCSR